MSISRAKGLKKCVFACLFLNILTPFETSVSANRAGENSSSLRYYVLSIDKLVVTFWRILRTDFTFRSKQPE